MHIKGRTECFECQPKPTPRSYPVCTIRNTPDKPIHCVVWAKDLLFARLFGPADAASDLDDTGGVLGAGGWAFSFRSRGPFLFVRGWIGIGARLRGF